MLIGLGAWVIVSVGVGALFGYAVSRGRLELQEYDAQVVELREWMAARRIDQGVSRRRPARHP